MLLINQIKLSLNENEDCLKEKAASYLHVKPCKIKSINIVKKSIDARRKDHIGFVYRVCVNIENENDIYKHFEKDANVVFENDSIKKEIMPGKSPLSSRPIVVGSGPCGLFCALLLAKYGYAPIVIERGKKVSERILDIEEFWGKGVLKENSNVQFGEGGAGTFSDGKLNTLIKDKDGFGKFVLETFVECGAPNEILYINKPHLGSDNLHEIIPNIRKKIEKFGGTFMFETCLTDINIENGRVVSITLNNNKTVSCSLLVLAPGHSARDTFFMLNEKHVPMQQKPFAMGVRIEHLQKEINKMQYGKFADSEKLPTADYKLTYKAKSGRGVYSFCMCPGGVVVNAASEKNTVVTNGMSYFARNLENANSAIVVNVKTDDFESDNILAGVEFQRKWEKRAYETTKSYRAPAQTVGNFLSKNKTNEIAKVKPTFPNGIKLCDLHDCLPNFVSRDLEEALSYWQKHFSAFSDDDAIMTGIETRTSSPVRILRDDNGQSAVTGIYPAGEGAGYAGGIMSAAIDGIKTARNIIAKFAPMRRAINE